MKHPMQPVVMKDGIARFQDNAIVRHLLDVATEAGICDMNKIARLRFGDDDGMQFAQLIGYSVSGFGDLNYASSEMIVQADAEVDRLVSKDQITITSAAAAVERLRALYEEGASEMEGLSHWADWQARFVIACFEEMPHLFAAVENKK